MDLKDKINNEIFSCQACVKGSLFLNYIKRVGGFLNEDFSFGTRKLQSENNEMQKLSEIFSIEQLHLLEIYFEQEIFSWSEIDVSRRVFKNIEKDIEIIRNNGISDNDIFKIITENMLENNGIFKPEKINFNEYDRCKKL